MVGTAQDAAAEGGEGTLVWGMPAETDILDPHATGGWLTYDVTYQPELCAREGVHLRVAETRRVPDAAIDQRVKNFNRMDLTRAQFEALNAGADAPLLCSTEGYIAEGPGFNLWLLRGRTAFTPRDNLLEGITRKTVFELCAEAGLAAEATNLTPGDLDAADEMFTGILHMEPSHPVECDLKPLDVQFAFE